LPQDFVAMNFCHGRLALAMISGCDHAQNSTQYDDDGASGAVQISVENIFRIPTGR
jgi:hypothetical protein